MPERVRAPARADMAVDQGEELARAPRDDRSQGASDHVERGVSEEEGHVLRLDGRLLAFLVAERERHDLVEQLL